MSKTKIGTTEAILIILTVIIAHSVLSLPRDMIVRTQSAIIIKFTFNETLNPNWLDMHEPIINSNIMNIIGVIWKYTIPIASQKFLSNILELTIK